MSQSPARKIVATMFMTLDGVVEDPHKWSFPYWDDQVASFKDRELKATDALLLGRVTYEGFAAAWPGRKDDTGFADKFNSMPKHVASRTLRNLTWTNSHLLEGNLEDAVGKLKAEPGGDIGIHGSVGLINELLPHGLIDRFHLLVYPLVLGQGKRLFREGAHESLKLVESTTFPQGVVAMIYDHVPAEVAPKPAGNPVYGRK